MMDTDLLPWSRPLIIGGREFSSSLIQGPLAGFSCAPFRALFSQFQPPAYAVSEMISAHDVLHKHTETSRYLVRSPKEKILCYQLAGTSKELLTQAALHLETLGADLIDLNCGCPKGKIRKKGAGSALLELPSNLIAIVEAMSTKLKIPLTVKIRIQGNEVDLELAKAIEQAGACALIVHGRRWYDDYDTPCDYAQIAKIKSAVSIPVIANGDIQDEASLQRAFVETQCDGYMVARGGSGHPWIYQQLLNMNPLTIDQDTRKACFMLHIEDLVRLEGEYRAILQSKAIARYYFKKCWSDAQFQAFYQLETLKGVVSFLSQLGP